MKQLPDESIDLIVTDPPYQLDSPKHIADETEEIKEESDNVKGFMGKFWDVLPSVEILKECCRVLKSGAFSFWLMTPRQDSLATFIMRLKRAGFNVNFTTMNWIYFTGFPKSMSISLAIDKRECRKQLKEKLGKEPSKEEFENEWKNFRKIIGQLKSGGFGHMMKTNKEQGFRPSDYYEESGNVFRDKTPVSPQAKALDGSFAGFQPKPSFECIVVAMKHLSEKSFVDQALKNGKGITWLEYCRIPFSSENDRWKYPEGAGGVYSHEYQKQNPKCKEWNDFSTIEDNKPVISNIEGRFPANIIVSGDALNDGTKSKGQQGATTGEEPSTQKRANVYGDYTGFGKVTIPRGDEGSYSRYFSLDAWWKEQIKKLPIEVQKIFPFLIVPKASKSERNAGCEGLEAKVSPKMAGADRETRPNANNDVSDRFETLPQKNHHPTVKPVELMSYLITLGSRPNDIILDPFAGSGTTAVACRILNRKSINFEKIKEYCEIAENRIKPFLEQKKFMEFQ